MSDSDLAVSAALAIGLAAATGFRVFLPMLVVGAAAYSGHLSLGHGFAWLGTPSAAQPQWRKFAPTTFRVSAICSTPWPRPPHSLLGR